MPYRIKLHRNAGANLKALDKPVRKRVARALDWLAEEPRPSAARKLQGSDLYRLRVGDWRILYEIADAKLIVYIIDIDHRSRVYKHLP